jgi:phage baseplate assembly protein W
MSFDLKIVNNDLSIGRDGLLEIVKDNEKLAQDVIKIILTPLGSNRYHRWYGSSIGDRTIGLVVDASITQIEAERAVQMSLSNLIALQQAQTKTQYVSPGETIASIREVSVLRDPQDPRQYQIVVSLLTRQLTVVEETFTLTI